MSHLLRISLIVALAASNLLPLSANTRTKPGFTEPAAATTPSITAASPSLALQDPYPPPSGGLLTPPPLPLSEPVSATATITPTLDVSPILTDTLAAHPAQFYPGEALWLTWNLAPEKAAALSADSETFLSISLPDGASLAGQPAKAQFGDDGRLLLQPEPSGELALRVAPTAAVALEFSLAWSDGKNTLTELRLAVPEAGLSLVGLEGGSAAGLGERVQVTFPPQAAGEPLQVRLRRPLDWAALPPSPSGHPFEITAQGQDSKSEYHKFDPPLTIEVSYDPADLRGGSPDFLHLVYYDETTRDWLPVPSQVDPQAGLVRGFSDHLSVFDVSTSGWEASRLPGMQAFQTSQYTGAAAYSFPLWTPPGPGGLQPSLELSYNSQAVDNSIAGLSQASWVGMGWSLDTGAIERNQNGTPNYTADDTFSISAGGLNSLLLPGADGYYHTSDENFWRIQYDSQANTWTAWDGQGNTYRFGDTDATRAKYPSGYHYSCNGNYTTNATTWRWSLHSLVNTSGKSLTYSYFTDYQVKSHPCDSGLTFNTAIAVYPAAIDYPHGQYRVVFNREARTDYKSSWTNTSSLNFYQRYRLQSVEIVRQTTVVKKYLFNYNAAPLIHPSQTWTVGGSTTTLVSLQELGRGGAATLPAQAFSYADSLHLTRAENGYGGAVEFVYESEPWYELDTPEGKKYKVTSECINEHGSWGPNGITGFNGGRAWCENQNGNYHLYVSGQVMMSVPIELLQPGAEYKGSAQIMRSNPDEDLHVEIGLKTSATSYLVANTATFTSAGYHDISGFAKAPAAAEQTSLYLSCDRDCRVSDPAVRLQPTRYRVVEKKLYDGLSAIPQIFGYRYDEAATNDTVHSAAAASSDPYFDEFSEFRGHALAQETGPDGRVTSTYFHQDDAQKGRAGVTIVHSQSFADDFSASTLNTQNWMISVNPTWSLPRLAGDTALQVASPDAVWRGVYRSSESITDGKGVLLQFKVSGQNVGSGYFLDHDPYGSANFWRWGVLVTASGQLEARFVEAGGASQLGAVLFGPNDFKRDAWYVVLLIVDDQKFHAAAWERDDPEHYAFFDHAPGTGSVGLTWRFNNYVSNGASVLDAYSEGNFYELTTTDYLVTEIPTNTTGEMPVQEVVPHDPYTGLTITWAKTTAEQSTTFGGDGEWVGSRATYEYDSYGNRTRSLSAEYDRTQNAWRGYRLALTRFFPNAGAPYLVSLPAASPLYACPADSFGVTCSSAYPTSPPNSLLVSARQFLYDGASSNTQPPAIGRQTGERTLLRWGDPGNYADPRYQDADYTLDEWGNRTLVKVYNSEGTATVRAGSNPDPQVRSTQYQYDGTYNTYLVKETNPKDHMTTLGYDYDFGLPNSQTDANGVASTATYDAFGRMIKVVRLPDTDTLPTFTVTYHDNWQPFGVELVQRINQGTEDISKQVRFYDGLGRAVQSQTVGAVTSSGTVDLVVDSSYDAYGKVLKQTVPYELPAWTGGGTPWRGQQLSQAGSVTIYDLLGRPLSQAAPGTSPTIYSYSDGYHLTEGYGYSQVCITNPRGNQTCQISDLFGRTRESHPPAGPGVVYTYNQADRLVQAAYGSAVTTLTYDLAGRKTQMIDADMGTWMYAYDALGNLTRQTDAKSQRICLYYDALNRLAGKHYRTDDACPASPSMNVSYTYDAGTYGKPRRTGMIDASGSTTWSYDLRGRLTEESKTITGSGTFKTQWDYNSADLPTWMKYPADNTGGIGEQVSYNYHPQMLLKSVLRNTSPAYYYVQNISYDSSGRVDIRSLGAPDLASNPALKTDDDYFDWNFQNGGGRLKRIQSGTPSSPTSLQDLRYYAGMDTSAYDPNGNLLNIYDYKSGNPQTQSFSYDTLDRLTSAQASGGIGGQGDYGSEAYAYDPNTGNLSSKGGNGTYFYGAANHAHAVTSTGNGWSFQYDLNGNMTQRVAGGTYNLAYDAENRFVAVSGAASASFTYNGDGVRVKGVAGGVTTTYLGDYFEWTGSTGTMKKYYSAGGTRVAMRTGTANPLWLLGDHLGSTGQAVNYDGTAYTNGMQLYKAWGEQRFPAGASGLPTTFRYTGQRQENSIGLYWVGSRWYDTALGRWVQPDSIIPEAAQGVQAWDRYAYSNNSPALYSDPSGHCIFGIDTVICIALAGAAIGAAVGYGAQVYNNYRHGSSSPWKENISAEPIVGGAFLGAGAVITAPAAVAAAGDVLVGAGLATGSTALFGAGMSAYEASTALGNAIFGTSTLPPPIIKPGATGGPTAGKPFPDSVRQQAFDEDPSLTCVWCGTAGTGTQVDHAIPKSLGGNSTIDNAQLACPHCNASRGARDFPRTPPDGYRGSWPPPWWRQRK